jgi:membrane protease subunit HflC
VTRLLVGLVAVAALSTGLVAAANFGWGPLIVTREDEQKIILLLDQAKWVTQPGLSARVPLIMTEESYDRRWLYLNTEPDTVQTRDGEQLIVDNYAIWRIEDAIAFKRAFQHRMEAAEQRLDRAVRDDVREVIGRHTLTEVLTEKRAEVMEEIKDKTRATAKDFGVGIADVRINRTELPEQTMDSVFARMRTERERLAKKNRAEGELEARRIRAEADADARVIVAKAQRDAEIARGEGEAQATRIYAEAYGSDPEFYAFMRSLEAYRKTIGGHTTLVLSPKAEFFRFLESAAPDLDGAAAPAAAPPPPAPAQEAAPAAAPPPPPPAQEAAPAD